MIVEDIIIRLDQIGPQVIDGDLSRDDAPIPDDVPCLIVYGGTVTPRHRHVDGAATAASQLWRVVVSSNNPAGARYLVAQVTGLLDGWRMGGAAMRVNLVSEPVENAADPSDFRWSSTVEASIPTNPARSNQ